MPGTVPASVTCATSRLFSFVKKTLEGISANFFSSYLLLYNFMPAVLNVSETENVILMFCSPGLNFTGVNVQL